MTAAAVLLATCAAHPEGEEWTGTTHLDDEFAARGIEARWVRWDDPAVDWSQALVAVRSTWDYTERLPEFLSWARALPRLLNDADIFEWNTDKAYLAALGDLGVPIVPAIPVDRAEDLESAIATWPTAVVKPRVGAGGRGVVISPAEDYGVGPWVVQPLVESVRTVGETSVFVIDGSVASQVQKVTTGDEIRVHEIYGGSTVAVDVTGEARDLALAATAAAETLLGRRLDYGRVDALRLADGTLAVSELELTEPGLYLEIVPGNARAFVDLVEARLG